MNEFANVLAVGLALVLTFFVGSLLGVVTFVIWRAAVGWMRPEDDK